MTEIQYIEREMTPNEYKRVTSAFNEHTVDHGNPVEVSERIGFVALDGEKFIGTSTGLAYKDKSKYYQWFYLSDLLVEKEYRGKNIGKELLLKLEKKIKSLGIKYIWTWTAGYEAPEFYRKQGYQNFFEMKDWFPSGHSRVGMYKEIV